MFLEFSTPVIFNENNGFILNSMELLAVTGRGLLADNAVVSTSYSVDGVEWSQPRTIDFGSTGYRDKRLVWFRLGMSRHFRIQKFTMDSRAYSSFLALTVNAEGLSI